MKVDAITRVERVRLDEDFYTFAWEILRPDGTRAGGHAQTRELAYKAARAKLREWVRDDRKDARGNVKRRPRARLPWEGRR